MNRYVIASALTGLILSLVFGAPALFAAANNNSVDKYKIIKPDLTAPMELESPTGTDVTAKGTAGGITKTTVDGMCLGTPIKITATTTADGGVAILTPGQWYEFKIVGGSSTYGDGCFRQGAAVVTCLSAGTMTIEAGERFHEAFLANAASVDGGALDQARLFFLATSTSGLSVTIAPKIPCK